MPHEPAPSQDAETRPFPWSGADPRARRRARRPPAPPGADPLARGRGNQDWYYGVNRAYLQELVEYWRTGYDWRKAEAAINAYEHDRVEVEGVPVLFLRRPRVGPNPTPLICTHGWPWTFWHWAKVIDPLADPAAHGGDPAEAFEVIVPSLPGFGFSTPLPENPDMNFWKGGRSVPHPHDPGSSAGHRSPRVSGQLVLACLLSEPCCPAWGYPSVALGEAHHSLRR